MAVNTYCIRKVVKMRRDFHQYLRDYFPATIDVDRLLRKVEFEDMDIDGFEEQDEFHLMLLSRTFRDFIIEEYKELDEYIIVNEEDLYYFFPVGHATREFYVHFDFETEQNVRRLKLKHPRLMETLPL